MRFIKKIFLLFSILVLIVLCFRLSQRNENKEIAKLTITGNTSKEKVEWKNPFTPLETATLVTYEVILSLPGDEEALRAYFFGELIGIRYKILELHPFLHWIGFKDPIEIDSLCSDYLSPEKKRRLPSKFISLEKKEPSRFYETIWKKMFYKGENYFFVRRSSLKVEYFPLLPSEKRSFHLFYQSGEVKVSKS